MKRFILILSLVLPCFAATANAQAELDPEFFHDTLAPYGEWASVPDYGDVWHPTDVDEQWSPYSDGYWAYTDAGWTWVSYEDWGGITYHYGRWVRLEDYGWCWVPGNEWGPAWVSWRQSDDYVGWAPLPPEARWRRDRGFGIWVDTEYDIGPGWFHFCRTRDFGSPFLRPVLLPARENFAFIEQTNNITNTTYRADRGHAFNGGPAFAAISLLTARPIPALKLVRTTDNVFTRGSQGNVLRAAPQGNTFVVGAPRVAAATARTPAAQAPVARSFTAAKIDRGWSGVKSDPATHERIRSQFSKQTGGATPQTAPARAFQPGLVAAVPKKADANAKIVSGASAANGRGPKPATVAPGTVPAIVTPPKPATASDSQGDKRAKKNSKPVATTPAVVVPQTTPKTAATTPAVPGPQRSLPGLKQPTTTPAITTGPREDRSVKKPFKPTPVPQPAAVVTKPQAMPKIAAPAPVQPKDDSAARIAREKAAAASASARQRDNAAAAADAARRNSEAQRAAKDQARIAEAQRSANMQRQQQQAAAGAAEAARRQAAAAKVPPPVAAPPSPQRGPAQVVPQQPRPANPKAVPDPRRPKGKDDDAKK